MKNKLLKVVAIFILAAFSVAVLAMAGAYLVEKIGDNNSDKPKINSNNPSSQDDKPAADTSDGNSSASIEYSGKATVNTAEKAISLHFKNPSKSKKSISLVLVAIVDGEEVILGKKERLLPGDLIEKLDYNANTSLENGDYSGKYILHFYNEVGEEEIVNSEVLINVRVN